MDSTDRHLLALLQADGQLGYRELGDAVGLSAAAAYQRIKRLEAAGVIAGYHARLDPAAVGRRVLAFVRVEPGPGGNIEGLIQEWRTAADVLECHRVSGATGFLLKVRVAAVGELEALLDAARRAGCRTSADVGLATLFERWALPVASD